MPGAHSRCHFGTAASQVQRAPALASQPMLHCDDNALHAEPPIDTTAREVMTQAQVAQKLLRTRAAQGFSEHGSRLLEDRPAGSRAV
ncbi:hypothetical protein CFBP2533_02420 [Xanthomonas hortorum pv. pelargonii]|uniref:Uncharacterized protein n=1 Tax=Xanthomonas hortorum pv. pelargonii TaxID=453602 RepID=A0A6V7BEU3_9XANT|nr:hypothetical protein CFBP2533_02420 [Xanthomonas hortorum pv. pelargonii]CAD0300794.1 hypothetical protein CFBP2533_02420 [Xanthomonas hortorum pv. pelargonii]